MKAFSPAGPAVKAFFGYGAKTFGNPAGQRPARPVIWRSIASPSTGVSINGITTDGVHLYITNQNGDVWNSVDGGNTWNVLTNTGAGGTGGNINYQNGVLIVGGGGGLTLARSLDNGLSWTLIDTGIIAAGTLEVSSTPAGRWCAFGNVNGVNNHGYSIDGGQTWIVPGLGGLPNNDSITFNSLQYSGVNGVEFTCIDDSGIPAFSNDGTTWQSPWTPIPPNTIICGSLININGQYVASINNGLVAASTIAGLQTAPLLPITTPFGDRLEALVYSTARPQIVGFTTDNVAANSARLLGPWTTSPLPLGPGEEPSGSIYDAVHDRFVVIGLNGGICVGSPA